MIIPITAPGEFGVVKDKPAHSLPVSAWSDAVNVRFNDGYAEKSLGYSSQLGTPSIAPYFLLPFQSTSLFYWIYAGLTSAYITEGTSHTDITRSSGAYNATANESWTGGTLAGIPILCNGFDAPQMLFPASPSNALSELSNWPADTNAKVIKPFKNFLIALNMVEGGADYPYVVRWSTPADPGTVPTSWDYTDTTNDAGRVPLSEGGGGLVDGGALRDAFIIYREFSTYSMDELSLNLIRYFPQAVFSLNDALLNLRVITAY